jgi:hypothetical protein
MRLFLQRSGPPTDNAACINARHQSSSAHLETQRVCVGVAGAAVYVCMLRISRPRACVLRLLGGCVCVYVAHLETQSVCVAVAGAAVYVCMLRISRPRACVLGLLVRVYVAHLGT